MIKCVRCGHESEYMGEFQKIQGFGASSFYICHVCYLKALGVLTKKKPTEQAPLTIKDVKAAAEQSDEAALKCCKLHWEQNIDILKAGMPLPDELFCGGSCACCHRFAHKQGGDMCGICPLAGATLDGFTCCKGLWVAFVVKRSVENAEAIIAFIEQKLAELQKASQELAPEGKEKPRTEKEPQRPQRIPEEDIGNDKLPAGYKVRSTRTNITEEFVLDVPEEDKLRAIDDPVDYVYLYLEMKNVSAIVLHSQDGFCRIYGVRTYKKG